MLGLHRHAPDPPDPPLTGCRHEHEIGTCPSCQRAKAARLHAQDEECALLAHPQRERKTV